MSRFIYVAIVSIVLTACVSTDIVRFKANTGQTALIRDGRAAVSSIAPNSIVLFSRLGRDIPQGQRVGFVVAIMNRSQAPLTFNTSEVQSEQTFSDRPPQPIEVISFEKLRREEQTRQVIGAILVGVAAGANAAAASRAGYYSRTTSVYTPQGTYIARTTGYSPVAAAVAQNNAAIQNSMMINSSIAQGQANMARLENEYIKDHSILPGEWYGGVIAIEPPTHADTSDVKTYSITLRVGGDVHKFDIIQEPNKR